MRELTGAAGATGYAEGRCHDSNLRLWYRPLNEDHPETLVVMVIEKH